jgi:hypothetical protein
MITLKYDIKIKKDIVIADLDRIINQIFKLLPLREEGGDWQSPLRNLIIEVAGLDELLLESVDFFSLLCKMEALLGLTSEDDFFAFRRTIFECLNILSEVKKCLL